jgi:hypothetical protein
MSKQPEPVKETCEQAEIRYLKVAITEGQRAVSALEGRLEELTREKNTIHAWNMSKLRAYAKRATLDANNAFVAWRHERTRRFL